MFHFAVARTLHFTAVEFEFSNSITAITLILRSVSVTAKVLLALYFGHGLTNDSTIVRSPSDTLHINFACR
jgi:hypothetical protein